MGNLGYSSYVSHFRTIREILLLAAMVVWGFVWWLPAGQGQSPSAEPTKATAIKLPDGTVVFWTKNPDEANPAVEGVVLSPQDYKSLVEQAELARKAKSQAPSAVAIRGKIESRGERFVAALSLTYSFRTTQPRTLLVLGCQRGVLVGAKSGQGKLPILNAPGDEGLTLLVDSAGEQTVTLDVEVPVLPRGLKNELGFDLGLPKAAITTLKFDAVPATGIKTVSLGTRVADVSTLLPFKPSEVKRYACTVEQLVAKPVPLGATDLVEVTWEPATPALPKTAILPTVDSELVVRVEETQIETVAKLRLRGNQKEWPLQLPVGSDVTIEREGLFGLGLTGLPETMPPTVVRPSDPNQPLWLIRTPGDTANGEWLVTVTVRVQRPKPNDSGFRGPYAIGPFVLLGNAKQSGRINVFAGPSVRLGFKPLAEFRRQDLPALATEDHIAQFTFAGLPETKAKSKTWLEVDARVAPTAIRAKSAHALKLTSGGWRLETTVRVAPPLRGEIEQLLVEMPAEWPTLEATPEELVESVHIVKDGSPRILAIRFNTPQKTAFALKLLSTRASVLKVGTSEERESKLTFTLPRFPQTDERETTLVATVPDGFEVRGNISLWEGGQPSAVSDPLVASNVTPNRVSAIGSIGGTFDRAIARVELAWQTYRPALVCENRVEVSLQQRQVLVQQVLKFKPSPDDRRPVRLRGPDGLLGLQSVPPLDPVGPGLWEFRSANEPGKEFSLTVAFAVKLANANADPVVNLLWPETATRTDTVLRVWGGATGRRVNKYEGDWRELSPEPSADRDALPLLTLAASGPGIPLALDLSSLGESGLPTVWVERAYVRASVGEAAVVVQEKLLLKRWLGSSLEVELPRLDTLELWVDEKPVEALPQPASADATDTWILTVPLPESKPNKMILVELRYRAASPRTLYRERLCHPPIIRGALYRTPLRWLLGSEPDLLTFVPSGSWDPEFRWAWRGFGFAPTANESPQELDAWLRAGGETTPGETSPWLPAGGEILAGRQSTPQSVPVLLIPKLAWMAVCSGVVLLLGLGLFQLRTFWLGLALAVLGIGFAVVGAVSPQGLAQVLAGSQPGALASVVILAGLTAWRSYQAKRLDRLPGFSRERNPVSILVPLGPANPDSGNRPSRQPVAVPSRIGLGSTVPPIAPENGH